MTGSRQGFWQRLLWQLVYPRRNRHRAEATASGMMLVFVSIGIGLAAYNSSNNILFITLALLLSSLLLSGLLSWINLKSVRVQLQAFRCGRAQEPALVELRVSNERRFLPALGFWFELRAEPEAELPVSPELSRLRRQGFRRRLSLAEALVIQGRQPLHQGLAPGEETCVEWAWTPPRRGRWLVQVVGVGSLFPFGFLRKFMHVGLTQALVIRPAEITYATHDPELLQALAERRQSRKRGEGAELFALRPYRAGDSHRLVHWKASARLGQLLVRENAAESGNAFTLRFDPDRNLWPDEEKFEVGLRLAARLASDLFTAGSLNGLWLGDEPPLKIRRAADLEAWLDRLSCATRLETTRREGTPSRGDVLLEIRPEGPNGAAAYAQGHQVALA